MSVQSVFANRTFQVVAVLVVVVALVAIHWHGSSGEVEQVETAVQTDAAAESPVATPQDGVTVPVADPATGAEQTAVTAPAVTAPAATATAVETPAAK